MKYIIVPFALLFLNACSNPLGAGSYSSVFDLDHLPGISPSATPGGSGLQVQISTPTSSQFANSTSALSAFVISGSCNPPVGFAWRASLCRPRGWPVASGALYRLHQYQW